MTLCLCVWHSVIDGHVYLHVLYRCLKNKKVLFCPWFILFCHNWRLTFDIHTLVIWLVCLFVKVHAWVQSQNQVFFSAMQHSTKVLVSGSGLFFVLFQVSSDITIWQNAVLKLYHKLNPAKYHQVMRCCPAFHSNHAITSKALPNYQIILVH